MAANNIDLIKLFGTVAKTMAQNKESLNQADTYNHDHGDHMVEIFDMVTQAMKEKKTASPTDQLAYASQILRQKSQSGSAQIYAEGLSDAATQFKGKSAITADTAMQLIQALLGAKGGTATLPGGGTQSVGGGDLLGSLLGGLMGGQQSQPQQPATAGQAGPLGQIDLGDLLNAGMAFAQTKKSGGTNLDAILNAVVSSSRMSDTQHRAQSGALVADTLLQMVGKMAAKK